MTPSGSAAKGGDGAITPWVLACFAFNVVGGVAVSMLTIRVGRQVDVQSLIFLRMVIGVTMACVMMRLLRIRWVRDPHGRLARRSLFSALSAQATYISIASLPLATSTGIMHTHPVWTAVLGWFFLGVAVRAPTVAAIALCLIGALLTSWPPAAGSEFGMCCGFLGAFFSSCSLVATRSTQGFSAWQTIAHSSCCSGALALAVMLVRGEFGTTVRTLAQDGNLLLVIVIASVIGCLAQLAFVVAGQRVDAVVGSTFRLLEIPLALLVSGIVIEATEPSGFERYLGAGSILLGSAWLTLYSVPLSGKRLARRVVSKRPWLEPTIDALR